MRQAVIVDNPPVFRLVLHQNVVITLMRPFLPVFRLLSLLVALTMSADDVSWYTQSNTSIDGTALGHFTGVPAIVGRAFLICLENGDVIAEKSGSFASG